MTFYYQRQNLISLYWIGPFGIYVPDDIDSVIDIEQGTNLLDEDEYKKKYAVKNPVDGKWYYNRCNEMVNLTAHPKLIGKSKSDDMHCVII